MDNYAPRLNVLIQAYLVLMREVELAVSSALGDEERRADLRVRVLEFLAAVDQVSDASAGEPPQRANFLLRISFCSHRRTFTSCKPAATR
jgi:hypothetical protein